jgi:hypothetical protein
MRTIIYVDGFNLYYGALKGTPFKWLNLDRLCRLLLPKNEIVGIKYFTATVSARPHDPDQPTRQQTYLRALRTLPNLEIIYGHFLAHEVLMPRADNPTKPVGILNPQQRPSRVLVRHASFIKQIRGGPLQASQFPAQLRDANGLFRKPAGWYPPRLIL